VASAVAPLVFNEHDKGRSRKENPALDRLLSGKRRQTGSQQPAIHQALKQAIPTIAFKKGEIYDNQ
jgi:hypothetical protein